MYRQTLQYILLFARATAHWSLANRIRGTNTPVYVTHVGSGTLKEALCQARLPETVE